MYRFFHHYRVVLSSGFFLLASLLLAAVNPPPSYRVDPVGALLLEAMHPLQLGVTAMSRSAERFWDQYIALWSLRQENEKLRRQLEALEGTAHQAIELDLANQRLGKLLALREEFGDQAV